MGGSLLTIWSLLRYCGVRNKLQVVYKEFTRDRVKSMVSKSECGW